MRAPLETEETSNLGRRRSAHRFEHSVSAEDKENGIRQASRSWNTHQYTTTSTGDSELLGVSSSATGNLPQNSSVGINSSGLGFPSSISSSSCKMVPDMENTSATKMDETSDDMVANDADTCNPANEFSCSGLREKLGNSQEQQQQRQPNYPPLFGSRSASCSLNMGTKELVEDHQYGAKAKPHACKESEDRLINSIGSDASAFSLASTQTCASANSVHSSRVSRSEPNSPCLSPRGSSNSCPMVFHSSLSPLVLSPHAETNDQSPAKLASDSRVGPINAARKAIDVNGLTQGFTLLQSPRTTASLKPLTDRKSPVRQTPLSFVAESSPRGAGARDEPLFRRRGPSGQDSAMEDSFTGKPTADEKDKKASQDRREDQNMDAKVPRIRTEDGNVHARPITAPDAYIRSSHSSRIHNDAQTMNMSQRRLRAAHSSPLEEAPGFDFNTQSTQQNKAEDGTNNSLMETSSTAKGPADRPWSADVSSLQSTSSSSSLSKQHSSSLHFSPASSGGKAPSGAGAKQVSSTSSRFPSPPSSVLSMTSGYGGLTPERHRKHLDTTHAEVNSADGLQGFGKCQHSNNQLHSPVDKGTASLSSPDDNGEAHQFFSSRTAPTQPPLPAPTPRHGRRPQTRSLWLDTGDDTIGTISSKKDQSGSSHPASISQHGHLQTSSPPLLHQNRPSPLSPSRSRPGLSLTVDTTPTKSNGGFKSFGSPPQSQKSSSPFPVPKLIAGSSSGADATGAPGSGYQSMIVNSNSLKRRRPGLKLDLTVQTADLRSNERLSPEASPSYVPPPRSGRSLRPVSLNVMTPQTPRYEPPTPGGKPKYVCTEVLDHLYIGSMFALMHNSEDFINEHHFTALIDCSTRRKHQPKVDLPEGISTLTLHLRDKSTQDISGTFFPAIQFIENVLQEGGRVFVFCQRGISRSATIILAYLIWRHNWDYQEAVAFLKQKRAEVSPNVGFAMQLMLWATTRPSRVARQSIVYKFNVSEVDQTYRTFPNGRRAPIALTSGPVTPVKFNMFKPSRSGEQVEDEMPRCWIVCAPSCDTLYIWHDTEVPENVLSSAQTAAFQLITYEQAPRVVTRVLCGKEPVVFWQALALAESSEVDLSPSLRPPSLQYDFP